MKSTLKHAGILTAVAVAGTVAWGSLNQAAEPDMSVDAVKLAAQVIMLQQDVNKLKGLVPSQSHAIMDGACHFTNLWFAGQKKNWGLAEFNLNETRSHLRWAVRIVPVRKDAKGNEVRLEPILDAIDKTSLQAVADAIKAKDADKFAATYKQTL